MSDIIISSQEQFNNLPDEFEEYHNIYFDCKRTIIIDRKIKNCKYVAQNNSDLVLKKSCTLIAKDKSYVVAYGESEVEAYDFSKVDFWGFSKGYLYDKSLGYCFANSAVKAFDTSCAEAHGHSSVSGLNKSLILDYTGTSKIDLKDKSVCYELSYHHNSSDNFINLKNISSLDELIKVLKIKDKIKLYKHIPEIDLSYWESNPEFDLDNCDIIYTNSGYINYNFAIIESHHNSFEIPIALEINKEDLLYSIEANKTFPFLICFKKCTFLHRIDDNGRKIK